MSKTLSPSEVHTLRNLAAKAGLEIPAGAFSTPASTRKSGGKIFNSEGLEVRETSEGSGHWIAIQKDGSSRFTSNPYGTKKGTGANSSKAKPPKKGKTAATNGKTPSSPTQERNWALTRALRKSGNNHLIYNGAAWSTIKKAIITATKKPWASTPIEADGEICDIAFDAMLACADSLA